MKLEFPETVSAAVAAAKALDNNNWEIGDALLKECGQPGVPGSFTKLKEAFKEGQEEGTDPNFKHLRLCWNTSHRFPPERRHADLSFYMHVACETPDMLDVLIAGWPKDQPMTVKKVTELVKYLRSVKRG